MASSEPVAEPRWNCLNCRRRKVRCDRQWPCANCVRGQRDCVFPTSGRAFQRPETRTTRSQPRARQLELMDRVRQLENLVGGLGTEIRWEPDSTNAASDRNGDGDRDRDRDSDGDGETEPNIIVSNNTNRNVPSPMDHDSGHDMADAGPETTAAHNNPQSTLENQGPQPLPSHHNIKNGDGKDILYVGERFWSSLRREVQLVRESFENLQDDDTDLESNYTPSLFGLTHRSCSNGSHFIFGNGSPGADMSSDALPLPSQMLFIWQTFLEDVHPFVQVLHVPSVAKIIQDCRGRIEALDISLQPLMFAISLGAIRTLTEEEVRINFNQDRYEFLDRLRRGTERALARVDFINTTRLEVVQALAIFIFIIGTLDTSRYSWSLVGLLQRIAFSLDLHKDGSSVPGMSPFETEMRRRLWWQICLIEARVENSPVPGFNIAERHFDTREPTNVNDADLSPDMTTAATPREGFTETSIALVRCEVWRMSQMVQPAVAKICAGQGGSVEDIEKKLETLRRFSGKMTSQGPKGDKQPMQQALAIMSRVRANSWELMINHLHGPDYPNTGPDDKAFALALAIVQDSWDFQHDETFSRWAWMRQGSIHWQGMAIIFSYIASRPWDATSEDAWVLGNKCLEMSSDAVRADPLWQQLSQLIVGAQKQRARQVRAQVGNAQSEPATGSPDGGMRNPGKYNSPSMLNPGGRLQYSMAEGLATGEPIAPAEGYGGHLESLRTMPMNASPMTVDLLSPFALGTNGHEPQWSTPEGMNHNYPAPGPMDFIDASTEALELVDWNELVWTSGQNLL